MQASHSELTQHGTCRFAIGPLFLVVAAAVCAIPAFRVVDSLLATSLPDSGQDALGLAIAQHEEVRATSVQRFLGRSAFETPPPPLRKTSILPVRPAVAPSSDPPLQPASAAYDGPQPTGFLRSPERVTVFFGSFALREGETAGELTLLEASDAQEIRVRVSRTGREPKEYEISLWRATLHCFDGDAGPSIERVGSR